MTRPPWLVRRTPHIMSTRSRSFSFLPYMMSRKKCRSSLGRNSRLTTRVVAILVADVEHRAAQARNQRVVDLLDRATRVVAPAGRHCRWWRPASGPRLRARIVGHGGRNGASRCRRWYCRQRAVPHCACVKARLAQPMVSKPGGHFVLDAGHADQHAEFLPRSCCATSEPRSAVVFGIRCCRCPGSE